MFTLTETTSAIRSTAQESRGHVNSGIQAIFAQFTRVSGLNTPLSSQNSSVVWLTWVPCTFAEARDVEDEISASLAIFDPQPGDRRDNEFLRAILATEYPDRQPDQTAGGDQR